MVLETDPIRGRISCTAPIFLSARAPAVRDRAAALSQSVASAFSASHSFATASISTSPRGRSWTRTAGSPHRPSRARIKDFRKTWKKACEKAGYEGKLFHDFRRSAVRTLERSGVPRSTAMKMVGHKTESIYRRYAIVDEQMHREAATKLDAWAVEQKAKAAAEKKGQMKRFKKRQAS